MPSNRNCPLFLQEAVRLPRFVQTLLRKNDIPVEQHADSNDANRAEADSQSPNQAQETDVDVEASQEVSSDDGAEAEADIESELSIAKTVTLTAAAGIIAVLAGFIGNKSTSTTHELFVKASIISMCTTFLFGCCIFLFAIFRAHLPSFLTAIVRTLLLAALGSLALVVGFGVTFCFRRVG